MPKLDQQTDKQARFVVPSSFVPVEPPARYASKWDSENWKARKAAFAQAGLVEVRIEQLQLPYAPRVEVEPGTDCQIVEAQESGAPQPIYKRVEAKGSDAPRLLYYPRGEFAVSADGVLHCLQTDLTSLGLKVIQLDGYPQNCSGGAFQPSPHHTPIWMYVIPAGVSLGKPRTLRVPYYDVDYRYKEPCPMVP